MRLPPDYIADLLERIAPLCRPTGSVAHAELDVIIGKAARVAHVVPAAKPFVAGLWGALAAVQRAPSAGATRNKVHVPCWRFCYSASWLRALLSEDELCPLPLERLVLPHRPSKDTRSGWQIEFDASIFGGGAVLKSPDGHVHEYFTVVWDDGDVLDYMRVRM